ncbi:hypothetical protein J4226_05330 [Candidatus Pacearchaeota archaeon]|nr:hypothetical protein [Candidatus Pacearchaeota archaeon]
MATNDNEKTKLSELENLVKKRIKQAKDRQLIEKVSLIGICCSNTGYYKGKDIMIKNLTPIIQRCKTYRGGCDKIRESIEGSLCDHKEYFDFKLECNQIKYGSLILESFYARNFYGQIRVSDKPLQGYCLYEIKKYKVLLSNNNEIVLEGEFGNSWDNGIKSYIPGKWEDQLVPWLEKSFNEYKKEHRGRIEEEELQQREKERKKDEQRKINNDKKEEELRKKFGL